MQKQYSDLPLQYRCLSAAVLPSMYLIKYSRWKISIISIWSLQFHFFLLFYRSGTLIAWPKSTEELGSKTTSDINHAFLVHLLKAIKMTEYCAHFNICRLNVKHFLKWTVSSNNVPAKRIKDVMKFEKSAHWNPLKLAMFAGFPDLNLQKIGTGHIRWYWEHPSLLRSMPRETVTCESSFIFFSRLENDPWLKPSGASFCRVF